ncbi:hypothetical protein ACFCV3_41545 [Kribbella sp. NPDC056345]|uniref:hypothetical protein n=1 Tax=Kribbella sp. NPDC056345 TaxID=3345789 RepID=UPI0035D7B296
MYVSSKDEKQPIAIAFARRGLYPGTTEASKAGCLCKVSAEHGDSGEIVVVIDENCPLHRVLPQPLADVL